MAERTVSPAVFTNEIDSTFLIQGISEIGGAIVGPFSKGPAYSPTIVRSVADLEDLFGRPTGTYYQPFTAREYLVEQGVCTVVRVGSLGGYIQERPLLIKATLLDSGTLPAGEAADEVIIGLLANSLKEVNANGSLIQPENISYDHSGFLGSSITGADGGLPVFYGDEDNRDHLSGVLHLRSQKIIEVTDGDDIVEPVVHGDFSFSIDSRDPDSLHNVFGRVPKNNVKPGYFTSYFENAQTVVYNNMANHGASYKLEHDTMAGINELLWFQDQNKNEEERSLQGSDPWEPDNTGTGGEFSCKPAQTPWIQSQEISGHRYDLFRFWTRSFGNDANREVKVGIYNVRTPGKLQGTDYGTFSVMVRGFWDNDKTMEVLGDFRDVTLDPLSPRYLPRVVGDRYTFIDNKGKVHEVGDFANGSNWVRVEMPRKSVAPKASMPYGHAAYQSPIGGTDVPEPLWSRGNQYERVPKRYFGGAVFNQDTPDGILKLPINAKDALELFAPIPDQPGTAGGGFYLDEAGTYVEEIDDVEETFIVDPIDVNPGTTSGESAARGSRRFLVGFQGGFDGHDPLHLVNLGEDITATNVQGMDCSKNAAYGTKGYERAFNSLSNQDEFDINLLVTPGLSLDLHRSVINKGIDLCETREDCFYILDCVAANGQPGLVDEAVTQASTVDSNYAATYYPWIKIIDPATNALQAYPPSALMPAVYAANDKTAAEWFAPAGLNRGGLEQAISVMDRLNFAERDTLYEGKVNPIAAFPGQGIVAFGQKTLQRRSSALDRINVRRLLITLKKFIASTSRYLIFEQNVAATRQRFTAIVNPYLEAVQQRQGLYAFRVVMDESNNTPDLIDRNILYGQIFLQPARAVEYIILDFNLQSTGATFSG